jgi:hypothetical protein
MAYEPNVYITPTYDAIGYDALTHGSSGCCNNYFTLNKAYGNNCPGYNKRRCGGCYNGCGGSEIVETMSYFPGPELGLPISVEPIPYVPQTTEVEIDPDLINDTSVIYTGGVDTVQTRFVPPGSNVRTRFVPPNQMSYNRGSHLRAYRSPHRSNNYNNHRR